MTYLESLNDIKIHDMQYQHIAKPFFSSFLNVKHISQQKDISDKENQIRSLATLIRIQLYSKGISKADKIEFMDYLEKLQLALEVLEINQGKKDLPSLKKAAANMAKKMQSSVPGNTSKKRSAPKKGK